MSSTIKKIKSSWSNSQISWKYVILCSSVILIIALVWSLAKICLSPVPAYATIIDFLTKPFEWMGEYLLGMINKILLDICNGVFQMIMWLIAALTPDDLLTADWQTLFGSHGIKANGLYTMMTNISNGIIKPIASTILGCVFMMQFIKITSKAEQNGTVPLLKEVLIIFVIFMMFNWLVAHADEVCGAIYDIANRIAIYVKDYGSTQISINPEDMKFIEIENNWDASQYANQSIGVIFGCLFVLVLGVLGALICFVFAYFATIGRALQLYIYAMFSPIPMAMLGFDETRSWGVGYFRNFASVALASAILLFIMYAFPLVMIMVIDFNNYTPLTDLSQWGDLLRIKTGSFIGPLLMLLRMIAVMLVFIVGVKNSGKYAKAILGA